MSAEPLPDQDAVQELSRAMLKAHRDLCHRSGVSQAYWMRHEEAVLLAVEVGVRLEKAGLVLAKKAPAA